MSLGGKKKNQNQNRIGLSSFSELKKLKKKCIALSFFTKCVWDIPSFYSIIIISTCIFTDNEEENHEEFVGSSQSHGGNEHDEEEGQVCHMSVWKLE